MSRLLNTVVDKARGRLFTEKLKLIALASKRITFLVDITFWELAHAEFPATRSRSNPSASGLDGGWPLVPCLCEPLVTEFTECIQRHVHRTKL